MATRRLKFEPRQQHDEAAEQKAGELAKTDSPNDDRWDLEHTKQEMKNETDLNMVLPRFGYTPNKMLSGGNFDIKRVQAVTDFTGMPTFREIADNIHNAKEAFAELPASIRKRFNNDPGELWAAANDPTQHEELVRLGILKKEEAKTPPQTPKGTEPSVSPST